MSPEEVRDARGVLGRAWGIERPLTTGEMAQVLRLRPDSGSDTVRGWESGKTAVSGPVSLAIEMMLPPSDDAVERAIAVAGAVFDAPPYGPSVELGPHARAILEDIVLRVAGVMREPPTRRAALEGSSPVHPGPAPQRPQVEVVRRRPRRP